MQVRENNKKQIFENILNVNQTIFAQKDRQTDKYRYNRAYARASTSTPRNDEIKQTKK